MTWFPGAIVVPVMGYWEFTDLSATAEAESLVEKDQYEEFLVEVSVWLEEKEGWVTLPFSEEAVLEEVGYHTRMVDLGEGFFRV